MIRKGAAVFILFFISACLYSQSAASTLSPDKIVLLNRIRDASIAGMNKEQEKAVYIHMLDSVRKQRDEAAIIFIESWLVGTELELGNTDMNSYSTAMLNLIYQAELMRNDVLLMFELVNFVDHLRNAGLNGASLSYLLLANEVSERVADENIPRGSFGFKFDLIFQLYGVGEYQKANAIFNQLQRRPIPTQSVFFLYDLKSQIMLQLKAFDSSAYYIHLAQKQLQTDTIIGNKLGWQGILIGNLAKILFYQQRYSEAIPLFREAVNLTTAAKLADNTAPFSVFLAKCYLQVGQAALVRPLLPVMKEAVYQKGTERDKADMYKLILATESSLLSPERILQLIDSAQLHQQLLMLELDKNRLIQTEIKVAQQTYKEQQAQLESNIEKQLMVRNLLWGFLGLVVVVAVVIIYQKNKGHKQERQLSRKRQQEVEQHLEQARNQLADFTNTLLEKSRKIELLESNLEPEGRSGVLESLRQNNILTEQNWIDFKVLFEKAYPGFLNRAQKLFPSITAGELRFLAFIKLSFSNKEMAATLGVSAVSVRSIKSRLLKKLQLPEYENLELLVKKI